MAKNTYKMIKEIKEQPQIIKKIIAKHIKGDKIIFNEFKEEIVDLPKIKRFIFLGCGTSYHAALYGNLVFEEITKLNCEFEFADEFNLRHPVVESNTAIVVLSQSGETAEAIKAVKIARQKKAFLISVTNNKGSRLAKLSNVHIDIEAGREVAVPATKTFTSQLLVLLLLALFVRQIKGGKGMKLVGDIKNLPKLISRIVVQEKNIKDLAVKLKNEKDIIILGSKYNYPIALEGALKLKEAANIFTEGMTIEEYEHGPKALSGKVSLIRIKGKNLEIGKKRITVPPTAETLSSFFSVVLLQLLAFHIAVQKGINVDQPRNIKKFVK